MLHSADRWPACRPARSGRCAHLHTVKCPCRVAVSYAQAPPLVNGGVHRQWCPRSAMHTPSRPNNPSSSITHMQCGRAVPQPAFQKPPISGGMSAISVMSPALGTTGLYESARTRRPRTQNRHFEIIFPPLVARRPAPRCHRRGSPRDCMHLLGESVLDHRIATSEHPPPSAACRPPQCRRHCPPRVRTHWPPG